MAVGPVKSESRKKVLIDCSATTEQSLRIWKSPSNWSSRRAVDPSRSVVRSRPRIDLRDPLHVATSPKRDPSTELSDGPGLYRLTA